MVKDLYIFENAVQKDMQDYIEKYITGNTIRWFFVKDIAFVEKEIQEKKIKDFTPALNLPIIDAATNKADVNILMEVQPVLNIAAAKANLVPKKILQARSFMSFPLLSGKKRTKTDYHHPHIDMTVPHMVCLYYVNDADGDTFFFDKTRDDVQLGTYNDTKFKVIKRVTPKKGTAVIFNGNRYHASSSPTKGIRCILNLHTMVI